VTQPSLTAHAVYAVHVTVKSQMRDSLGNTLESPGFSYGDKVNKAVGQSPRTDGRGDSLIACLSQ
jgi:hypothetical protein